MGGQRSQIARWSTQGPASAWAFYTPKTGWMAYNVADSGVYVFTGTTWTLAFQVTTGGFVFAGTPDGSALINLNASNLSSGTIPNGRFPATLPAQTDQR